MKGTINLVKDAVHFASALKLQLIFFSSFQALSQLNVFGKY